MSRKKIALVLSGGAAFGFAHIGVLKAFEKYNIPIDMIVGTSMGALVGSAYCSGISLSDMQKFACKFKTSNLFDLNFNKSGLFSGKGVMKTINKFLPDINIENLQKKFACVAVDLLTEKEVVFTSGNIRTAVRSSMSIPGFFVPVFDNNRILIDGGVVNNLPDDVAKAMGADVIISVDVLTRNVLKHKPKNLIETIFTAMNIQTKEVQKYKSCHSDIILKPNTSGIPQMKFSEKNTLKAIHAGMTEVQKNIEEIKKLIQ